MRIVQKIRLCLWVLFIVVFAASGWASDDTELGKASAQTLKTQLAVERLGYGDIEVRMPPLPGPGNPPGCAGRFSSWTSNMINTIGETATSMPGGREQSPGMP